MASITSFWDRNIRTATSATLSMSPACARRIENPSAMAAELLAQGKIIGWFQGRSEFGPRALGHRSILADPTRADMKDEVNKRVKYREEFRPFAPAVLDTEAAKIFDLDDASPFM